MMLSQCVRFNATKINFKLKEKWNRSITLKHQYQDYTGSNFYIQKDHINPEMWIASNIEEETWLNQLYESNELHELNQKYRSKNKISNKIDKNNI